MSIHADSRIGRSVVSPADESVVLPERTEALERINQLKTTNIDLFGKEGHPLLTRCAEQVRDLRDCWDAHVKLVDAEIQSAYLDINERLCSCTASLKKSKEDVDQSRASYLAAAETFNEFFDTQLKSQLRVAAKQFEQQMGKVDGATSQEQIRDANTELRAQLKSAHAEACKEFWDVLSGASDSDEEAGLAAQYATHDVRAAENRFIETLQETRVEVSKDQLQPVITQAKAETEALIKQYEQLSDIAKNSDREDLSEEIDGHITQLRLLTSTDLAILDTDPDLWIGASKINQAIQNSLTAIDQLMPQMREAAEEKFAETTSDLKLTEHQDWDGTVSEQTKQNRQLEAMTEFTVAGNNLQRVQQSLTTIKEHADLFKNLKQTEAEENHYWAPAILVMPETLIRGTQNYLTAQASAYQQHALLIDEITEDASQLQTTLERTAIQHRVAQAKEQAAKARAASTETSWLEYGSSLLSSATEAVIESAGRAVGTAIHMAGQVTTQIASNPTAVKALAVLGSVSQLGVLAAPVMEQNSQPLQRQGRQEQPRSLTIAGQEIAYNSTHYTLPTQLLRDANISTHANFSQKFPGVNLSETHVVLDKAQFDQFASAFVGDTHSRTRRDPIPDTIVYQEVFSGVQAIADAMFTSNALNGVPLGTYLVLNQTFNTFQQKTGQMSAIIANTVGSLTTNATLANQTAGFVLNGLLANQNAINSVTNQTLTQATKTILTALQTNAGLINQTSSNVLSGAVQGIFSYIANNPTATNDTINVIANSIFSAAINHQAQFNQLLEGGIDTLISALSSNPAVGQLSSNVAANVTVGLLTAINANPNATQGAINNLASGLLSFAQNNTEGFSNIISSVGSQAWSALLNSTLSNPQFSELTQATAGNVTIGLLNAINANPTATQEAINTVANTLLDFAIAHPTQLNQLIGNGANSVLDAVINYGINNPTQVQKLFQVFGNSAVSILPQLQNIIGSLTQTGVQAGVNAAVNSFLNYAIENPTQTEAGFTAIANSITNGVSLVTNALINTVTQNSAIAPFLTDLAIQTFEGIAPTLSDITQEIAEATVVAAINELALKIPEFATAVIDAAAADENVIVLSANVGAGATDGVAQALGFNNAEDLYDHLVGFAARATAAASAAPIVFAGGTALLVLLAAYHYVKKDIPKTGMTKAEALEGLKILQGLKTILTQLQQVQKVVDDRLQTLDQFKAKQASDREALVTSQASAKQNLQQLFAATQQRIMALPTQNYQQFNRSLQQQDSAVVKQAAGQLAQAAQQLVTDVLTIYGSQAQALQQQATVLQQAAHRLSQSDQPNLGQEIRAVQQAWAGLQQALPKRPDAQLAQLTATHQTELLRFDQQQQAALAAQKQVLRIPDNDQPVRAQASKVNDMLVEQIRTIESSEREIGPDLAQLYQRYADFVLIDHQPDVLHLFDDRYRVTQWLFPNRLPAAVNVQIPNDAAGIVVNIDQHLQAVEASLLVAQFNECQRQLSLALDQVPARSSIRMAVDEVSNSLKGVFVENMEQALGLMKGFFSANKGTLETLFEEVSARIGRELSPVSKWGVDKQGLLGLAKLSTEIAERKQRPNGLQELNAKAERAIAQVTQDQQPRVRQERQEAIHATAQFLDAVIGLYRLQTQAAVTCSLVRDSTDVAVQTAIRGEPVASGVVDLLDPSVDLTHLTQQNRQAIVDLRAVKQCQQQVIAAGHLTEVTCRLLDPRVSLAAVNPKLTDAEQRDLQRFRDVIAAMAGDSQLSLTMEATYLMDLYGQTNGLQRGYRLILDASRLAGHGAAEVGSVTAGRAATGQFVDTASSFLGGLYNRATQLLGGQPTPVVAAQRAFVQPEPRQTQQALQLQLGPQHREEQLHEMRDLRQAQHEPSFVFTSHRLADTEIDSVRRAANTSVSDDSDEEFHSDTDA